MKNKPVNIMLLVVIVATWMVFMVLTSVRAEGVSHCPRHESGHYTKTHPRECDG